MSEKKEFKSFGDLSSWYRQKSSPAPGVPQKTKPKAKPKKTSKKANS